MRESLRHGASNARDWGRSGNFDLFCHNVSRKLDVLRIFMNNLSFKLDVSYYVSLVGLTIRYFLASFGDPLPWSQCKEEWNTTCIDSSSVTANSSDERPQSSAEIYFM